MILFEKLIVEEASLLKTCIDFFARNKFFSTTAFILSIIYVINERILKPPKRLRHIPYQGYFELFKSIKNKESYWDRSYRLTLPYINSPKNNNVYLRPGRTGWEVHIANPADAKFILLKHDLFPKANMMAGAGKRTLTGKFMDSANILFSNGHIWKSQRMIANPAFRRSMPVKLFGKLTVDLFKVVDDMPETVEVTDLMERWTLDAIGKAGFGFDFNAIREKDNPWVNSYNMINKGIQDPLYLLFPLLDSTLLGLFPKRKRIHLEMDKFLKMIDHVILNKREDMKNNQPNEDLEENERDLLSLMIEGENRGEGILTNGELKSNLCLFFLAGHETTTNALSFIIYYLAKYPHIQQKARDEAIRILGDEPFDILPTADQLKQIVYINQVIKETLRLNGPTIGVLPRIVSEDIVLPSGVPVPKGVGITVDIFNIHHCEKYWTNPDQFDPERFNENYGKDVRKSGEGLTYLPFGNGARQCLGMNFSLVEQRVMLLMLLRKYVWNLPDDSIHKDKIITAGMFIIAPQNLKITFQRRY
ncbi:cytochrome P450 [Cokeromyces recurvatus]|uniref:cytochrome P450 n=1 Tax=Cokeromyces recurvatus TaxID=90255 RepID=UPI00221F9714|nr:cytochrome P450 [Cokeromyces recurvatus]KAI7899442.1 cytochrome P450 [Cokeromyces recurvatus]